MQIQNVHWKGIIRERIFLVQLKITAGFMINPTPEAFGEHPTFIVSRSTFCRHDHHFFSEKAKGAKFSFNIYVPLHELLEMK